MVLLAAAVLAAVVAQSVRAHDQKSCQGTGGEIIWAAQVTQEEGNSPNPPTGLIGRANQLAACGGGELISIRAAGQGGVQTGPGVSLRIYRDAGEVEHDPTARDEKVRQLVALTARQALATRVPGDGRDVLGLLATVSSDLGSGQNDVWLRSLGLPTVDPADARKLMAADPAQAVASIPGPIPPLRNAQVHLILSPPAGMQPRFNVATDAWRRQFMVDLLKRAGADVVSVTEDEALERPAHHAPPAPVVPNLPDSTPQQPPKPRPHATYTTKLDSSALFKPDSAHFAASVSQVLAELQSIISGWARGLYSRVTVVGHCARFGPAAGALQLSKKRAAEVAGLLRSHGVSNVTSLGVGFNQPLPPDPRSPANRVVIITAFPRN